MGATGCGSINEAACDIDDSNTLDVKHDLTVGGCQDLCAETSECHFFTWYPSVGTWGTCWLLDHCGSLEVCPYCVSGPSEGVDVDDCVSSPSTSETPQTTTSGDTTSAASASTAIEDGCNMFTSDACDIDESNQIDIAHSVTVDACQDLCRDNVDCHFFTWNNVYGLLGTCWLLDHCNFRESCSSCISGPAEGVDIGTCSL